MQKYINIIYSKVGVANFRVLIPPKISAHSELFPRLSGTLWVTEIIRRFINEL